MRPIRPKRYRLLETSKFSLYFSGSCTYQRKLVYITGTIPTLTHTIQDYNNFHLILYIYTAKNYGVHINLKHVTISIYAHLRPCIAQNNCCHIAKTFSNFLYVCMTRYILVARLVLKARTSYSGSNLKPQTCCRKHARL